MPILADQRDLFGKERGTALRAKQLALPLAWVPGSRQNVHGLLIDDSNAQAARHIAAAAGWPEPASILVGPPKSGKSLMGRMFAGSGAGEVIDDITTVAEEDIFHAWNRAATGNHALLVIAPSLESIADVQLADLRTRLAAAPVVEIGVPGVALAAALIERLLAERGMPATPQVGTYIAERIDRCYTTIAAVVDAVDSLAMASGRPLGIGLAREVVRQVRPIIDQAGDDAVGHHIVT